MTTQDDQALSVLMQTIYKYAYLQLVYEGSTNTGKLEQDVASKTERWVELSKNLSPGTRDFLKSLVEAL